MTDEQIIRARVLMAEQGIHADDLADEQVAGLVRSLGRIYRAERVASIEAGLGEENSFWLTEILAATINWPRGNFEPILAPPPPS